MTTRISLSVILILSVGLGTVLLPSVLGVQPAKPQTKHFVAEPPRVEVRTTETTEGSARIITYTVTPRRVFDMTDFHVKTLAGNKIGGVSSGALPAGWTPKANKGTKSYSWAARSAANAEPLPEGRPTVFSLRITNSNARVTPAAFWYATRNGKTVLPPLVPGGVTPRPGTAYVGMGRPTPVDATLKKKRPTITFGPKEPTDQPTRAPYLTVGIPEYTLGEQDESSVGVARGGTWTGSALSTETETLFTVLLTTDRSFASSREAGIVAETGNDIDGVALAHFFEGNTLSAEGQCGFSILVGSQAPEGQEFFALVVADDDRNGVLDLNVDIESDVYAFRVE